MVVELHVHCWRGQRKLRPQDLGLSPDEVPEIFSLGRKLLVPRESIRTFSNIEKRASTWLDNYSWTLPIGGHFVPFTALEPLLDQLKKIQKEFDSESRAFLKRYERYQQRMARDYPEYAHALEGFYPSKEDVRSRFSFEISLFEIRMPKNVRAKAMAERTAMDLARKSSQKASEESATESQALNEYRRQLQTRMNRWMDDVAGALRQDTVRVCQQIAGAVTAGKLHPKQVNSLNLWVERFKGLNFMNDHQMDQALSQLSSSLSSGAKAINSEPAALAAVGAAVTKALEEAQREAAPRAIAGEYRRRVRV